MVLGFTFKSLNHIELLFVSGVRGLISFFFMWISNFLSAIC